MRKVIALRGLGNSGKSSSLRKVYELLVVRYALNKNRVNVKIEGALNKSNTSVIVSINGVRIGIDSAGDQLDILVGRLRDLEFKGCAIIVCASRTAASFEAAVNDLERCCYEIEWIEKTKEGTTKLEWDAANLTTAEDIVAKIEDLL